MGTADVSYQGWDERAMREAGDFASYAQKSPSPSFTAINRCPTQLYSPPRPTAASETQRDQAKTRTTAKQSRRRNLTVASYLGLGDSAEPAHLLEYAPKPVCQPHPPSTRKRRIPQGGQAAPIRKRAEEDNRNPHVQRLVSENLRVTKPLNQPVTHKLGGCAEDPLSTLASTIVSAAKAPAFEPQRANYQEQIPHSVARGRSNAPPVESSHSHVDISMDDNDDDFDQLCFDFEPSARTANDSTCSTHTSEFVEPAKLTLDEEDFGNDLMDDDLLDLTNDALVVSSSHKFQSSLPVKIYDVNESLQHTLTPDTSTESAVLLDEEVISSSPTLKKFVSPVTLTTRLLAATSDEARKPIVRPAFPAAVRDRSPIVGLSSHTLLRTCFRVGEAINQSCQAVKTGNNILIELYARVLNSKRDDMQQQFTFCDLFHAKPPYLQATYSAAIWRSVQLFEYDSARLLQQGRICRCIGTIKRDGKNWTMTVLNVWEATWDDVQWVEGIVNS